MSQQQQPLIAQMEQALEQRLQQMQQQHQQQQEQLQQQLQQMNQRLQVSEQALHQYQTAQTGQKDQSVTEIQNLMREVFTQAAANRTNENQAIVAKPTKTLPELATFTGTRKALDAWMDQARNKMSLDYASCPERTKLFAVWSKVGDVAGAQMAPWFKRNRDTPGKTFEDLLTHMETIYGDPHKAENARREIYAIKQRNSSFQEFYAEFDRLLQLAGGDEWPDHAKIGLLDVAVNKELQAALVTARQGNETWGEFVSLLIRVSNALESAGLAGNSRNSTTGSRSGGRYRGRGAWAGNSGSAGPTRTTAENPVRDVAASDTAPMDWEPTPARTALQTRTTRQRARWVSGSEVSRRRANKLCVRCGESDHFVRNCPYESARPPNAMVTRPVSENSPEVGPVENESDSGNE